MILREKKPREVNGQAQKDTSVRSSTPQNMRSGLTKKQLLVFNFVKNFVIKNKYSPSYEEIAKGLGYKSKSAIHSIIINLHSRGWINRKVGGGRSIIINT